MLYRSIPEQATLETFGSCDLLLVRVDRTRNRDRYLQDACVRGTVLTTMLRLEFRQGARYPTPMPILGTKLFSALYCP
jgi:hypothetical protein